jgi:hypothetical protein
MVEEDEKVEEPSPSCAGWLLKVAWLKIEKRINFVWRLREGDQGRSNRLTSSPQR